MILLNDIEELALTRFMLGLGTPDDRPVLERIRTRLGHALDGRIVAETIASNLSPKEPA